MAATGAGSWTRKLRAVALAVVLAAAIVLQWRGDKPAEMRDSRIRFTALDHTYQRGFTHDPRLTLEGIWRMDSRDHRFDSFSAMVVLPDRSLLLASDRGHWAQFAPPGTIGKASAIGTIDPNLFPRHKVLRDIEALTRRGTTLWMALEQVHTILRFAGPWVGDGLVRPPAMRGWAENQGMEALVGLVDGRFVGIGERRDGLFSQGDSPALLFAGDPLDTAPAAFRYRPPEGTRATDMAQLPDGSVLVLNRGLDVLRLGYRAQIVRLDPAQIRPGRLWRGQVVASLAAPLPVDNMEGLAIDPQADGSAVIWLVSDDNRAAFQRSLLMKLNWREGRRRPAPAG